jgi:STE24 endopeptidase
MYAVMPMFNSFERLPDGRLRGTLERMCKRCGEKVDDICVMDASRRSGHSNAFVCGAFGKMRIVIFDTMFRGSTPSEIAAVVGHEIGHRRLHHLLLTNVLLSVGLTASVTVCFWLMKCVPFYHAFGYSWVTEANVVENYVIGFSLASTFIASFTWVLTPLAAWISRRMEYAADRYSARLCGGAGALSSALMKLSAQNLSDIFPHPAYEFVNWSHPSLLNRLGALGYGRRGKGRRRRNARRKRT